MPIRRSAGCKCCGCSGVITVNARTCAGGFPPAGTVVSFYDGATLLGTATTSAFGTATFTANVASARNIRVEYVTGGKTRSKTVAFTCSNITVTFGATDCATCLGAWPTSITVSTPHGSVTLTKQPLELRWFGKICVSGVEVGDLQVQDPQDPDCPGTSYDLVSPLVIGDVEVNYTLVCIGSTLTFGAAVAELCRTSPPEFSPCDMLVPCLPSADDCITDALPFIANFTMDQDSIDICEACDSTTFEFTLAESRIGGSSATYTVTI